MHETVSIVLETVHPPLLSFLHNPEKSYISVLLAESIKTRWHLLSVRRPRYPSQKVQCNVDFGQVRLKIPVNPLHSRVANGHLKRRFVLDDPGAQVSMDFAVEIRNRPQSTISAIKVMTVAARVLSGKPRELRVFVTGVLSVDIVQVKPDSVQDSHHFGRG